MREGRLQTLLVVGALLGGCGDSTPADVGATAASSAGVGATGGAAATTGVGGGGASTSASTSSTGGTGGAPCEDATGGATAGCCSDAECDDGIACTADVCVAGQCVTEPGAIDCDWPAEPTAEAVNLTPIEGAEPNDFYGNLSGAAWDSARSVLWLCRNDFGVWAATPSEGGFVVAEKDGLRGEWALPGDVEDLTLADPDEPETLYVIAETEHAIREYDLSVYGSPTLVNEWDVTPHVPVYGGGLGPEAITFVPDSFLAEQGFVDPGGEPYTSVHGMGGLMLVGHQNGGALHAFDLDRVTGQLAFVGAYETTFTETAAVHFDRSDGNLYVWHGANHNTLEVARLSSNNVGGTRKLDARRVYAGPLQPVGGSNNMEGFTLAPMGECVDGHRSFWLQIDDGGAQSLLWFQQFSCSGSRSF